MTDPTTTPDSGAEVAELLERRATIEHWLARLDDYGSDVSARVTERVRGDYEARLREIVAQLASRQDAVRAELDTRLQELARAEDDHAAAREAQEEAILRQRIGELSQEEWDARGPELEGAVAAALERLEALRSESARLERALADLAAPPPAAQAARAAPEDSPMPFDEQGLPRMMDLDAEPEPQPFDAEPTAGPEPGHERQHEHEPQPEVAANDLAFLEELDRAIASPSPGRSGTQPAEPSDPAPRRGAKCPECGYTNDVGAWYCGVCGVDLP